MCWCKSSGTSTSVIAVRVVSSGHRTYDLGIALLSSSLHRCSLVCGERLMQIFLHELYLTIKKKDSKTRDMLTRAVGVSGDPPSSYMSQLWLTYVC